MEIVGSQLGIYSYRYLCTSKIYLCDLKYILLLYNIMLFITIRIYYFQLLCFAHTTSLWVRYIILVFSIYLFYSNVSQKENKNHLSTRELAAAVGVVAWAAVVVAALDAVVDATAGSTVVAHMK